MSVVRFIPQVNRLGKAMAGPGGKKVSEAIDDAQAGLDEIAPPCVEAIDEAMARIAEITAAPDPLTAAVREAIYSDANQIFSFGAMFGLEEMGKGAWSLCELIDISEQNPPSTRAAINAHVSSLRLLRAGDALPEDQRATVLAGLEQLLAHVRSEAA